MLKHRRVLVAVDFDGTLCRHEFPRIGQIIQPAFDTLIKLQQQVRPRLILWTCRENSPESYAMGKEATLQSAVDFCQKHGLLFDTENENWQLCKGFAEHKVLADFYIDDRNIDWNKSEDEQERWDRIYKKVFEFHCFVNDLPDISRFM